jgi:hypothetical protein
VPLAYATQEAEIRIFQTSPGRNVCKTSSQEKKIIPVTVRNLKSRRIVVQAMVGKNETLCPK